MLRRLARFADYADACLDAASRPEYSLMLAPDAPPRQRGLIRHASFAAELMRDEYRAFNTEPLGPRERPRCRMMARQPLAAAALRNYDYEKLTPSRLLPTAQWRASRHCFHISIRAMCRAPLYVTRHNVELFPREMRCDTILTIRRRRNYGRFIASRAYISARRWPALMHAIGRFDRDYAAAIRSPAPSPLSTAIN